MNAFIVNQQGEATDIFNYDGAVQPMEYKLFASDDIEKLRRIKGFFKQNKNLLTKEIISRMKELRAENKYLEVKEMMEKYIGQAPCCVPKIDALLDGL